MIKLFFLCSYIAYFYIQKRSLVVLNIKYQDLALRIKNLALNVLRIRHVMFPVRTNKTKFPGWKLTDFTKCNIKKDA